jgi:hypothetical protein
LSFNSALNGPELGLLTPSEISQRHGQLQTLTGAVIALSDRWVNFSEGVWVQESKKLRAAELEQWDSKLQQQLREREE